jgi:hypothetical protein
MQRLVHIAALSGPASSSKLAASDVEANSDPLAIAVDDLFAPLGSLQRGGTYVDSGASGRQRSLQRFVVADASGKFDAQP